MTTTSHNKRGRLPVSIAYFAALSVFGSISAAWGPALPSLAGQMQTNLRTIGLIFTIIGFGFFLASSTGARIYDRVPGNPVMACGLFVMAAVSFIVPVIPTFWLLTLLLLLLGFAQGLVVVGANTLLVWENQDNVGPWMNGMNFFHGIGALLAPIIVAQALVLSGEITWAFRILALLLSLAGIYLLIVPSPTMPEMAEKNDQGNRSYFLVAVIGLLLMLYVGAERSFGSWLYTYSLALYPLTEITAGYLTSAFWGAITIGRLLAIPVAARVSSRKMLLVTFPGGLLSIGVILTNSASLPVLWICSISLGIFMASIFPSLVDFANQQMKLSGRITGMLVSAVAIGSMIFPWASGQVFERISPHATMALVFVLVLIGTVIYYSIAFKRRAKTLPD
jgi:MFS transporter, FHS family, Na+ dependent glucose transporter 1